MNSSLEKSSSKTPRRDSPSFAPVARSENGVPAVRNGRLRSHIGEPFRRYVASISLSLAEALLKLAFRFRRAGLLDRSGVKPLIRASETLCRLSWRLWR
jgi:hypothetical protein